MVHNQRCRRRTRGTGRLPQAKALFEHSPQYQIVPKSPSSASELSGLIIVQSLAHVAKERREHCYCLSTSEFSTTTDAELTLIASRTTPLAAYALLAPIIEQ